MLTYVGAYEDRQVIAAIRRELLREGQVFFIHNRVQSIDKAAARSASWSPRRASASAHGQMGEHQLEQVMVDFWEKRFDVLVCTTIVESGLDVSNANTMIDRARRHPRPVPAAPAARPGRARPRAGLRLLPLPAGEAADRDRPRAAGHDRPALRPRRRHGDRDEGPRDPRRGQPARRRAVRPHRRRRLRPLRAARRRGGRGVPRRRRPRRSRRSRSSCRSTRTCRTTTCRASGCASRCTSGWRRCASDEDVDRDPRGADRPLRRAAGGRRQPARGGALPRPRARRPGSPTSRSQGKYVRFAPVELPDSASMRLARLYPKSIVKANRAYDPRAAPDDRGRGRQAVA